VEDHQRSWRTGSSLTFEPLCRKNSNGWTINSMSAPGKPRHSHGVTSLQRTRGCGIVMPLPRLVIAASDFKLWRLGEEQYPLSGGTGHDIGFGGRPLLVFGSTIIVGEIKNRRKKFQEMKSRMLFASESYTYRFKELTRYKIEIHRTGAGRSHFECLLRDSR
jgi:hypothetical protein